MTISQMAKALTDVGACFAVTTAKTILPNDPFGSKPSYHIHPDCSNPRQDDIERVYSQEQFQDWVRTMKVAKRAVSQEEAYPLWIAYQDRWSR
jgi:hypothetical protein